MPVTLAQAYLILLGVMSLVAFITFAADKIRSKKETNSRTPEIVLLSLITFGGAFGGLCVMYLLRHKTNFVTKFHFGITVWLSAAVQAALAVLLGL
jgi:uncharacterized membrane protein YsdA (DUF1294 family)